VSQPPRLVCRSTTPADLGFVTATESAGENAAWVLSWSREQHLQALDGSTMAHWILETQDTNRRAVGFVILAGVDPPGGSVEFKRLVVREKGVGFGREAVQLVKREVFGRFRAHRLWLDVFEHNQRAKTLYASEGFEVEGTVNRRRKFRPENL
jgi:diamine N-acetyltransferase